MNGKDSVNGRLIARRLLSASYLAASWMRACLYGSLIFGATAAFAADDNKIIFPSGSEKSGMPSAISSSGSFNFITILALLIIAAVGAWMFIRNRGNPGAGRDLRALSIDETRSLGNKQFLVVASYEDKKFLLGVCPGRIDLLAPLHQGEEKSK